MSGLLVPISVEAVIPIHNRRELTLQCLRSLFKVRADGLSLHVIVVDDGSVDGSSESIAREFPQVQVIRGDGSLFYTAAMNIGFRAALSRDPDYVVGMNDDSVFDVGFLEAMVRTAEAVPKSVVGALLLDWEKPHQVLQVGPRWNLWAGGYRHWRKQTVWTVPSRPWEVDLIVGNCVMFPAAALRECGLMDAARLPQFGDAELTPRMRRRGWRLLIDPRARVFCQPNIQTVRLREKPLREILRALFSDPYGGYSLRRRFYTCYLGGPGKAAGLAAFLVSIIRTMVGRSFEAGYGLECEEPRMDEFYRGKTV